MKTALKIRISPYSKKYGQGVIDLIVSIQQNEFGLPITADDQPDLMNVPDFYQKQEGNFWIALHDNRVVGTIALLDIGNHRAALRKMFVDTSFRGDRYGVAKKLLKTLLLWAEVNEFKKIYLGTTPKFLAAHRFYEKNHFVEVDMDSLPKAFPVMKVDTKFYMLEL